DDAHSATSENFDQGVATEQLLTGRKLALRHVRRAAGSLVAHAVRVIMTRSEIKREPGTRLPGIFLINTGSCVATALCRRVPADNAPTERGGYSFFVSASIMRYLLINRLRLRPGENFLETWVGPQAIPPPAPQ